MRDNNEITFYAFDSIKTTKTEGQDLDRLFEKGVPQRYKKTETCLGQQI